MSAGLRALSADQKSVLASALDWFENGTAQVLTVGGYAGTGKTTLIGVLRNELEARRPGLRAALAAYTGKASRVLDGKVRQAYARFPADYVGTIHGLIYSRTVEQEGKITGWVRRKEIEFDLVILDEASMVHEEIWKDLLSFGRRVIAVGDHGQLPPVEGKFNLMEKPELELVRIHRQAARNPILRLSQEIRRRGTIPTDIASPEIRLVKAAEAEDSLDDLLAELDEDALVLCGSNRMRVGLNRRIRAARGREEPEPGPGERVICLRNNWNVQPPICNGMLGTILEIEEDESDPTAWSAMIQMDDEEEPYMGRVSKLAFNQAKLPAAVGRPRRRNPADLFDFGYALTVHKAQGSEARSAVVFVEKIWTGDLWRRWLYTAVTRARERLVVVH